MKKTFLLSISSYMLLLALSFLSTFAQNSFVPLEWAPQVSSSEECELSVTFELSEVLATVAQLVKGTNGSPSLSKSCMEIKESSPASPSGYYTINNGTGSSVVVYCNMDELYSYSSLEQTLKGFSGTLTEVLNTVTRVSSNLTEVSSTVTGVSSNLTGFSNTLTGVSNAVTGISSDLIGVSSTVTGVENTLTEVSNTMTGVSNTVTGISSNLTGVSNTLTGVSNTVKEISSNLTRVSDTVTGVSNTVTGISSNMVGVSNIVTGMSSNLTGVSNTVVGISSNLTGVSFTVTEVSDTVAGIFSNVSNTVIGISNNLTAVSITVTGVADTVTEISSKLMSISNTLATNGTFGETFTSCQEVWDKCPVCTSGYYKILAENCTEKYIYCCIERCGIAGPWTRVAFLNMSANSSVCPNGTQKFVSGSAVACGIQEPSDAKCVSIVNSTTHSYSQICGQVAGYQKGSSDAFATPYGLNYTGDINGNYVDGVSITRGSPRQHVWSYAIGNRETKIPGYEKFSCSCGATGTVQVPSFVGSDYYCESGCSAPSSWTSICSDDVLWDGQQCGDQETDCCTTPNQPWFHNVLDIPSSDSIEIRLCIDESTDNENTLVSLYDIYIK